MLKNTFSHIPGVSLNTEHTIWRSDIYSWDEFLDQHHKAPLSIAKREKISHEINNSIKALENDNHAFFNAIPNNQHWRVYKELKDSTCFLDIETTGLDKYRNSITVIGLYDGKESKLFVQGKNLQDFAEEIKNYSTIVSFNGRCFDVPFIQAKFPQVDMNHFHIDLRFAMKDIGFSGGLKRIEKEVGITRDDSLQEVDGYEAVRLWKRYQRGDQDALQLLLEYNKADIENLQTLMDFTFDKLKDKHFHSVIDK